MTPNRIGDIGVVWWCEVCHKSHTEITVIYDDGTSRLIMSDCTA